MLFQARSRAPAVVSICLLAAVALQVWGYVQPQDPRKGTSGPATQPNRATALDVAAIVRSHLFGQADAATGEPQATRLSWTLAGTYASDSPEAGMAIVSDGQQQRLYRVGDEMPGGAVLREIHSRSIVFELDGTLQELSFPLRGFPQGPAPSLAALNLSGAVEPLGQQAEGDMRTPQEVATGATEWHVPPGPDDPPGG